MKYNICVPCRYESGFIKKIVKDTSSKLPPPPVPLEIRHPIGLESRFGQVKSLLDIESNTGVCMLGIYGDAGIGKTTLAAFLYNKIRHRFQAASFLTNIREKSNSNSISGLEDLHRTLLYETVKETQTMVHTTFERDSQIKRKLTHKRVLLILDDVDSIKQLEALAGGCHWFGSGSRIIITTRVESELDKHDVAITKYKMEELNSSDSLELLCWHAFNMSKPKEHYADICNHAVSFAKGFPRALKVLGSNLKGLSTGEWEMELEKYEKVPDAFSFLVGSF